MSEVSWGDTILRRLWVRLVEKWAIAGIGRWNKLILSVFDG